MPTLPLVKSPLSMPDFVSSSMIEHSNYYITPDALVEGSSGFLSEDIHRFSYCDITSILTHRVMRLWRIVPFVLCIILLFTFAFTRDYSGLIIAFILSVISGVYAFRFDTVMTINLGQVKKQISIKGSKLKTSNCVKKLIDAIHKDKEQFIAKSGE